MYNNATPEVVNQYGIVRPKTPQQVAQGIGQINTVPLATIDQGRAGVVPGAVRNQSNVYARLLGQHGGYGYRHGLAFPSVSNSIVRNRLNPQVDAALAALQLSRT